MRKLKNIVIERAEGRLEDLLKVEVKSYEAANKIIQIMAVTAPPIGNGYDKTDFIVTWDDEIEYKGRLDLQYEMSLEFDLQKRIKEGMDGMLKSDLVSKDDYNEFIENYLGVRFH